jgi:hypothetical protein
MFASINLVLQLTKVFSFAFTSHPADDFYSQYAVDLAASTDDDLIFQLLQSVHQFA